MPDGPPLRQLVVPVTRLADLPDGRAALVTGDPQHWSQPFPAGSLTSACLAEVLRGFGIDSGSIDEPLSVFDLRDRVAAAGLLAEVEWAESPEDLALQVELGRVVVPILNPGIAWDQPDAIGHGEANHPVLISAIARDPHSAALLGIFLRDPAVDRNRFLSIRELTEAWLLPGGIMLSIGLH